MHAISERTPTRDQWSVLRSMSAVRCLFPKLKRDRHAPCLLATPVAPPTSFGYYTCISTCLAELELEAAWEVCFGLKVYIGMHKITGEMLGIKAPVHVVLRRRRSSGSFEYKDPSPEIDERCVLFIPCPEIYSQVQKEMIFANPGDARMGYVLFDLDKSSDSTYSAMVQKVDWGTTFLMADHVEYMPLFMVCDGDVCEVDRQGLIKG